MICINSDGYYLTHLKFYEIQYQIDGYVSVVNDIGKVSEYPISCFQLN